MTSPVDLRGRTGTRTDPDPGRPRVAFAVIVLAGLVVSALTTVLPTSPPWSVVKLAAATYGVLLLPGAVILRAVGWPRSPAAALAGSAAWSIAAVAPGLVLVFVLDRGVSVALIWLVAVIVGGLVVGRGKPVEMDTSVCRLIVALAGLGAAFAVLVWLAHHPNDVDAIEHIARVRKLTELDPPRTLEDIGLLPPDTGLHPGYAFPLWHAVVALIVQLTSLEETLVFRSVPPLLVPFVVAAVYGAGRRMFGCRAAGVAAFIAYLAVFAFPEAGVGRFDSLSYPGFVAVFVLWPLMIDRVFAYLRHGGREPVWTVAAASFVMAATHASYNPLTIILIGSFAAARLLVVRRIGEARRFAVLLAAASLPFLVFLIWLYPIADTAATGGGPDHFATLLDRYGNGMLRLKPEYVTRGGAAYIAALLLVPLTAAAARTRAAAFIAAGIAVPVLILIVPLLYTPFADVMSVSQSRRFLYFLPWAFSLVGGALVLARFRHLAVGGALAVGVLLQILYPGSFTYEFTVPGPGWVAWVGAIGGLVVLVAGAARRVRLRFSEDWWVVAIVTALAIPVAIGGLPDAHLQPRVQTQLEPAMIDAVRENVRRDDVVLAPLRVGYAVTARAPVYIVAATLGHGGDTVLNQHQERRIDVATFFSDEVTAQEAADTVRRWDVDWILVSKDKPYPSEIVEPLDPASEGATYALFRVNSRQLPGDE